MRIDEMITKVKMHCFNEMHGGKCIALTKCMEVSLENLYVYIGA